MTDYVVHSGVTSEVISLTSGFFGADSMDVLSGGSAYATTVSSGTTETVECWRRRPWRGDLEGGTINVPSE